MIGIAIMKELRMQSYKLTIIALAIVDFVDYLFFLACFACHDTFVQIGFAIIPTYWF